MDTETKAWEQLPGESSAAFRAYSVYRDLGPARTVVDAYRQASGKKQALQASGCWNTWAARHDWQSRAVAWDRHLEQARLEEVEQATRVDTAEWLARKASLPNEVFETALIVMRRGRAMVNDPGSTSGDIRRASAAIRDAVTLAREAVQDALPPPDRAEANDIDHAILAWSGMSEERKAHVEAELRAFRERQQEGMREMEERGTMFRNGPPDTIPVSVAARPRAREDLLGGA